MGLKRRLQIYVTIIKSIKLYYSKYYLFIMMTNFKLYYKYIFKTYFQKKKPKVF